MHLIVPILENMLTGSILQVNISVGTSLKAGKRSRHGGDDESEEDMDEEDDAATKKAYYRSSHQRKKANSGSGRR